MQLMQLRAALIAEGEGDRGLVDVVEALCSRKGFEVELDWANERLKLFGTGSSTRAKVQTLLDIDPHYDVIFVHRDADGEDPVPRRQEIAAAFGGQHVAYIAVVPIQETEAWLLIDESAIRAQVRHEQGTTPLGLPRLRDIEQQKRPKEKLREALRLAFKHPPNKLTDSQFGLYRRRLLESLDIDGPINQLSAWQALVHDTQVELIRLCLSQSS